MEWVILDLIGRAHAALLARFELEACPPGVPLTGARVIMLLASHGVLSSVSISKALQLEPSHVSRLVDRLVSGDLVIRTPCQEDRRVVSLHLTADGAALAAQIGESLGVMLRTMFDGLNDQQLDLVTCALTGLVANAT